MGLIIPAVTVFVLTFGLCATIYFALEHGNRPVRRRLQDVAVKFRVGEENSGEMPAAAGSSQVAQNLLEWAQRRLPEMNVEKPAVEKLVQTLQYAGITHPAAPKIFQAARLALTVLGGMVGYTASFMGGPTILYVFFGAGVCYTLPIYALRSLAQARQIKIKRELPDAIDLLVVCVECGMGLMAAIRIVGRESGRHGRLMGRQLIMASTELNAGASLADALKGIADRTGVDDVKTVAAILVQSEKLGTEMAQALRATAEQLRVRRTMRAEEMAQKLPVKMLFPLMFFLLPATILIVCGPPMIQILRFFNFH